VWNRPHRRVGIQRHLRRYGAARSAGVDCRPARSEPEPAMRSLAVRGAPKECAHVVHGRTAPPEPPPVSFVWSSEPGCERPERSSMSLSTRVDVIVGRSGLARGGRLPRAADRSDKASAVGRVSRIRAAPASAFCRKVGRPCDQLEAAWATGSRKSDGTAPSLVTEIMRLHPRRLTPRVIGDLTLDEGDVSICGRGMPVS
jgi:hypothetical protein